MLLTMNSAIVQLKAAEQIFPIFVSVAQDEDAWFFQGSHVFLIPCYGFELIFLDGIRSAKVGWTEETKTRA